jgi:DNA-binding IclR family transcriptional regulator
MSEKVQVIDRIFDILEYLSLKRGQRGPTEIAEAVGLSKSTVHRLLSTMHERGYIDKVEDDGTYSIGIKLVEVVSTHINNLELQTEARPILNELQQATGLIVHLGILDHHEVVYVEKMDIAPNLRHYAQIGLRVPAQCSSLGKCMLSAMPGEELSAAMAHSRFEAYTQNSITSLEALREHLRQVRLQGWAMDNEEYIVGHRCIGAPIYDYRGETIAAVSASGPVTLLGEERVSEVVAQVQEAASTISRKLCYFDS